jgi:predicted 3-demethylubiquinone-9 3-methyltransferase (glyoxalase superfamily)
MPNPTPKNTVCIWYDKDAEDAARFYAFVFPDSAVTAVHRAPGDYPSGKAGDVLTVEFTVCGLPCLGLNGGAASACGWCKDRWGVSWQITPRVLTEAIAAGGAEAERAFAAMMQMGKIDVAAIEAARRG